MMNGESNLAYEFDSFRLIPAERQLLRDGQALALSPKAFDTLVVLVQNSGHVVKKDDLLQRVWPDSFVEESNLNHNISVLRKALGDTNGSAYVETVRGFGFRFNADVRTITPEVSAVLVQQRTRVIYKEEQSESLKTVSSSQVAVWKLSRLGTTQATLILALLLVTTAAVSFVFISRDDSSRKVAPLPAIHSIAVLPFKSVVAEPDEYLGLGMADALITKLGAIKQLRVRPTSAIQRFATSDKNPTEAGRELKVDAVMDGRFQRAGERLRITVQLINVRDGTLLWTGQFDEKASDVLSVEDTISAQAAQALRLQLSAWERERLSKPATTSPDAYRAYLKGRYFWNKRTAADYRKAAEYFQQAITLDPNYAQAYVGLADSYSFQGDAITARQHLERALSIDDGLADAHATMGFVYKFCRGWDWAGAEQQFKRSIDMNPNYVTAHHWYAYYLAAVGRTDEAVQEIKQAHELDPLSVVIQTDVGEILYFARRYNEAIDAFRTALEMDASFSAAHYLLGYAYEQKGMYAEALDEYQRWQELLTDSDYPQLPGPRGRLYALLGHRVQARKILEALKQKQARSREAKDTQISYAAALIYAALGDKDKAFAELERVFGLHNYYMIYAMLDPRCDTLRADERFQALRRRMNLN